MAASTPSSSPATSTSRTTTSRRRSASWAGSRARTWGSVNDEGATTPMIVDSHCHAWRSWPYEPPVPDPTSRGVVEQLLWEMDQNGVDKAVVICARIEHNPDNNDYVAYQARRFPERLYQFADVDCRWWETYHQPGAADRLRAAVQQSGLRGFTHYVDPQDDGAWYLSDEGTAFLQAAADLHQIASFAMPARLQ